MPYERENGNYFGGIVCGGQDRSCPYILPLFERFRALKSINFCLTISAWRHPSAWQYLPLTENRRHQSWWSAWSRFSAPGSMSASCSGLWMRIGMCCGQIHKVSPRYANWISGTWLLSFLQTRQLAFDDGVFVSVMIILVINMFPVMVAQASQSLKYLC